MDLNLADELLPNCEWSLNDVKKIKILEAEEVQELFEDIDRGEYTEMDIASACMTALYLFKQLEGR